MVRPNPAARPPAPATATTSSAPKSSTTTNEQTGTSSSTNPTTRGGYKRKRGVDTRGIGSGGRVGSAKVAFGRTIPSEVPIQSAQSQVLNPQQANRPPNARGAGRGQRGVGRGRRGGGPSMRGGGIFSSTTDSGNRRRLKDWLGTPEQWASDE